MIPVVLGGLHVLITGVVKIWCFCEGDWFVFFEVGVGQFSIVFREGNEVLEVRDGCQSVNWSGVVMSLSWGVCVAFM